MNATTALVDDPPDRGHYTIDANEKPSEPQRETRQLRKSPCFGPSAYCLCSMAKSPLEEQEHGTHGPKGSPRNPSSFSGWVPVPAPPATRIVHSASRGAGCAFPSRTKNPRKRFPAMPAAEIPHCAMAHLGAIAMTDTTTMEPLYPVPAGIGNAGLRRDFRGRREWKAGERPARKGIRRGPGRCL